MTEKIRGFEVAKGFENAGIELPKRSTKGSVGYDFKAAKAVVVPPATVTEGGTVKFTPVRVETGVKAYFQNDEVLKLFSRSSNPSKRGLILANSVGIGDSDYYGNAGNDGHYMFEFINISGKPVRIEAGDKIGQGMFEKVLFTDDDDAEGDRLGGHGSTD